MPFTPWTTLDDYLDMLDFVEAQGLIDHVDPVQYTIRLLVPPGSLLLETAAMRPHLGALDAGDVLLPLDASRSAHGPAAGGDVAALVARATEMQADARRIFDSVRATGRRRRPACPRRRRWPAAWPATGSARRA